MAKLVPLPREYPVPANWHWADMGSFVQIKSGFPFNSKRFSSKSEGKRPLIRIRDVLKGETITFTDEDCPEEYIIHAGEILIGMDGDFNIAKWQSGDALLNQRVCCIKSKSELLLNNFLYYYLPSPLKKINDATPSVTVKHLSTKTLNQTPIPLPPLPEQHRIVDHIESLFAKLDEAKEKAQAVVDGFEPRKSAILHKAFTGKLTERWRKEHGVRLDSWKDTTLSEIGSEFKYGTSEKSTYNNTGMPVLRIPNVGAGTLSFEDMKYLAHNEIDEANQIHENDLLIIRSNGSRDLVGKCAIVPALSRKFAYASFLIRIKPSEQILPDYLALYLNSTDARTQMFKKAKSSAGIHNINSQELGSITINVPTVYEQSTLIAVLNRLLSKEQQAKEAAEAVLSQIDTIKKAVLARAFRGELGTNDPTEEWAGKLLKTILER